MENIQYGCGRRAPKEWLNFNSSPTLRLQRIPLIGRFFKGERFPNFPKTIQYGNIVRGLPVGNECADRIYCSHVLEHLALEDFRKALKNTHQMLKPGGVFRFVLPDLDQYISEYSKSVDARRACKFMIDTRLGMKRRPRGFGAIMRSWLGGSEHLWMWDYRGMEKELMDAGFTDIRRAAYGDSGVEVFDVAEDSSRWGHNLGIQCLKPK